jgi:glycosyltransferase involved in cell wall biosynthesis
VADPTHDVVFFGNLSYPPNVAAVERLASMWPEVIRVRPTTTLLLAGARLLPAQADLAERLGWDVAADFDDLAELLAGTRLAVAPVDHASGIQNKVLEAAAAGLAQVITPQVAAGLDPDFPAVVAADDRQFVAEVVRLLDDDAGRRALGDAARQHLAAHYSAASLTPWAATIIEAAAAPGG